MTTILAVLAVALVISVLATLLMIRVSVGFGILDRPDEVRHFHGRPIPKLGGAAVFVAFSIPLMLLMHMQSITLASNILLGQVSQVGGLLLGSAVVLAVGLADDIMDLRPRWKILWQIVSAAVAYKAGFVITALSFPLIGVIDLGGMSFPVTVLWFLMCMNAVNLLDGHDGLAAGACLFVGLTLMLVSLHNGGILGGLMMAAFTGAVLGFLFFNFPPAKIFLGDSGSLLLGFLVAGLSLVGATMKAETAFSLLVPIVAMGLPFFDTLFAIMRRVYSRMPISMGDRGHIHHLLAKMGYSPRGVVLTLYSVTIALCALAFIITVMRNEIVLIVILGLAVTAFVAMRVFSGITPGRIVDRYFGDRFFRARVVKARLSLQNSMDYIGCAASVAEVWSHFRVIFDEIGVVYARLQFEKLGRKEELPWYSECGQSGKEEAMGWQIGIPLKGEGGLSGRIDIRLGESEHGMAGMPEFVGLLEKSASVLAERIQVLPCYPSKATVAEPQENAGTERERDAQASTFLHRALRHVRKYGLIHAVASFAGRFSPSFWRYAGPAVTREMIAEWLSKPGRHILNLGGGSNCLEGCLTVDIDPRAEVYMDITEKFSIPDSSVDGIFCEEVIEHIGEREARSMLAECLRMLKSGGVIRIVTPDLDYLAQNAADGAEGEQRINNAFLMHEHRHLYSRASLKKMLEDIGFRGIRWSCYRDQDSELGRLDSHADRFGHPPEMSQYIEAFKDRKTDL